jgi:hypothetical protein
MGLYMPDANLREARRPARRQRGFADNHELLIVIAILAMFIAITMPIVAFAMKHGMSGGKAVAVAVGVPFLVYFAVPFGFALITAAVARLIGREKGPYFETVHEHGCFMSSWFGIMTVLAILLLLVLRH